MQTYVYILQDNLSNMIFTKFRRKKFMSIENNEKKKDTIIQTSLPLNFEEKKSIVEEEIKKIDILNITPIEAINILSKLKEKVK